MKRNILSSTAKELLQLAIKSELTASITYKHLSNHSQRNGLFGAQKYFLNESTDELNHYQILVDFINDLGSVADIPAIDGLSNEVLTTGEAIDIAEQMEYDLLLQYQKTYSEIEKVDSAVSQFILQFIEIQRKAVGEYGDLQMRYSIAEKTQEILEFDEYLSEL